MSGLTSRMEGAGPYTVFGPSDEAFSKLPAGTLDSLLADKNKLASILMNHIVEARITATDTLNPDTVLAVRTMTGGELHFDACKGLRVNEALVALSDAQAKNGVIHAIDKVLLPSETGPPVRQIADSDDAGGQDVFRGKSQMDAEEPGPAHLRVCPSHNQCAKDKEELIFCMSTNKSACLTEMKGCVCPNCAITTKVGLTHNNYCVNGSERTQRAGEATGEC